MRKFFLILLALLLLPASVQGEKRVMRYPTGTPVTVATPTDAIPNSDTLPGTCTVGQRYMDTDATSGQRFYLCESTDTWKLQGDGAGGGTGSMTTVKEADTPVGDADIVTLDFGAGFDLAETPDTEIQITLDFSEAAPTLDQIGNLGASKTFTMAANNLTFNFTTPSDGLTLNSTGAFSDHILHIHQSSGNPGADTQLAHFQCVDPDVKNLVLEHSGDNASILLFQLQLNRASTSDNDEVYTSYYFDQDGTVSSQGELEFIRVSGVATDVSEDTEDAKITWDLMSGGSLTERMVLDNAGALQIDGGITAGDTSTFEDVRIFDSGNDPTLNIGDSSSGGDFGFLRWVSATDTLNLGTTVGGTFNDQITLLESGNVGIGTTDPQVTLDVAGGITATGTIEGATLTEGGNAVYSEGEIPVWGRYATWTFDDDTENVNPFLKLRRGKVGPANVIDDNWLGDIRFYGYGSGAYQLGAYIGAAVDGTPGDTGTDMPSEIFFMTSPDGSATPVLALTIGSDGNINAQDGNIDTTGIITANSMSTAALVITTPGNVSGLKQHIRFNIFDPLAVQTLDAHVGLIPQTDALINITNIEVTLDATTNQIDADLIYADTFIGLGNTVVVNSLNTTAGVLSDSTITVGSVPPNKALLIIFNAAPDTDITQMNVDIECNYD